MNLELFSCSGGMAEGFRRAGIRFDFVFDYDADACASYEKNLGHAPVRIDVHDLLLMVRGGWRPGPVELLVADPPCTPWSRAGKRLGLDDERDMLRETAELIALLRPATYLIGNVPGLQDASSWGVVQEVIGGLSRHGYCVDDYVQLDAADFGVPQHRIRPFWFGHLEGRCVRWPTRTHCSPSEARQVLLPGLEPLRPWVTCRDALGHLSLEDLGRPVRLRWKETDNHRATTPDEPAKTLTKNTHSDGSLLREAEGHPIARPEGVAPTIRGGGSGHSAPQVVLAESRLVGAWKNGNHLPSRVDEPALTVTAAGHSSASSVLLLNEKHPINAQDEPSMTVCAKDRGGAQGARALAQLGMAMPPPLAEVVARAIAARS